MKLSMWMLSDELSEFGAKSAIQDGKCEISSVRVFSFEETLSRDYAYIGNSNDFFDDSSNQVLLVHGHDIILIEHTDVAEVLNRIIQIFDKYRDWDERLRKTYLDPNPFQAVLDIAHEMFRCPMLFGHKSLRIYAITAQYTDEQVYDGWSEVKDLNTIPLSLLKRARSLDMTLYPDDLDPAAISTAGDDTKHFDYQIRTNCYFGGEIWGHMYLYYNKSVISPTVMQLARYTADVYGDLLNMSFNKNLERYEKYPFLVYLLDGKDIPESAIHNLYYQLNWDEQSNLVLYKITTPPNVPDISRLDWIYDKIVSKAVNEIVFTYNNSIVVISRQVESKSNTLLAYIQSLISFGDFHCGVSFTFSGLANIAAHYFQAGRAIDIRLERDARVHYFKDCAFDGLVQAVKSNVSWRSFVTPALFKLIEIDAAQGTEYYKTLYCLLINKGHSSNASIALYIHRNTLKYRLDKITQVFDMNIFDENIASYLRFCYALMMDDFPVVMPVRRAEDNGSEVDN
ncbi:MAG: helix-turn-helix domain-containing protein [Oscillospiraceae bacterium]|jgi:hypothetical protein|nr:helix-turn-helix domain-containing protein [Oscillospiraceae bacterium]